MHSGSINCPALLGAAQFFLYAANIFAHLDIRLSFTVFGECSSNLKTPMTKIPISRAIMSFNPISC